MTDRYEDLMARREALMNECWRRSLAAADRAYQEAPLVSASWRSEGIMLHPDGRLTATVQESDGHHRQRRYTICSELDGTIREVPPPTADAAEQAAFSPDPRLVPGRPEPDKAQLSRLARRHLSQAAAEAWLRLLSPAVRLARAEPGDPVVAQLGGLPALPINSWPVWPGNGPLGHVLTIDCASLAALMPGSDMPESGRLAFFYFDQTSYFHEGSGVGSWDPATQEGARVLWLHPQESTPANLTHAATPAPPGLTPFPAVPLTAVTALTWPERYDLRLRRIWDIVGMALPESEWELPPAVESLYEALHDKWGKGPAHQVGGHPDPIQPRGVEAAAEQIERALRGAGDDAGWHLLAQVDSDDNAEMMWGDVGKLYFMIRPDDLKTRRFDQTRFVWQCS
jgi:uncharacterized protein YwqG